LYFQSLINVITFSYHPPPPPNPPLFPYTTLFRSRVRDEERPRPHHKARASPHAGWRRRPGPRPTLGPWARPSKCPAHGPSVGRGDRKSTRLNSSHDQISYAVFCLKKKKNELLQHD